MRDAKNGLAKWAFALTVLVACTSTPDGPDSATRTASVGAVALPVTLAAALPGDLGARLGKTCAPNLSASAQGFLFGRNGVPTKPQRVIAPPKERKSLSSRDGRIDLPVRASSKGAARASIGAQSSAPTKVASPDGAVEIGVTLRGANPVQAQQTDGLVVYPAGHALGDVVQRATGDGSEDWLLLARAPQTPIVEIDVALTKGVAAIRQVGSTIELLDNTGKPKLRMARPRLIDDSCKLIPVDVAVTGCAVERSASFPIGKPHIAPGAGSCRIALSWPRTGVQYPAALDPSWSSAASMSEPRAFHTATKLGGTPDRVLVIGGVGDAPWYPALATAEIYDAESDTWSAAGSLGTARYSHAATTFGDGTVMVAGGMDFWRNPTATVESFTGTGFVAQQSMPAPAAGLTFDPLSADWAIAAGGYRWVSGTLQTVADAPVYYKPSNQWYMRTLPGGTRGWHASLATSAGVTFFGGERLEGSFSVLSSVVRYNSGVDTFTTLPSLPTARTKAKAALLPSGVAFLAGGETTGGAALARSDSAPLVAGTPWTPGTEMATGRIGATVTAAGNGAIVTGGYTGSTVLPTTTLFSDASSGHAGADMEVARYAHTATSISTGLLVAGGVTADGSVTATAEFATSTVCNEGAQGAPVSPFWGGTTVGSQSASVSLLTGLLNSTTEAFDVELSLRGEGLDGRMATRVVWSGPLAGGATIEVPIPPSDFPVQSVGSKSSTALVAVITGAPTMPHLVGVRATSAPLASSFDPTYTSVELTGEDESSSGVLEGVTSPEDIADRMGTLGVALQTSTGQVWDGSAFVDLSTLPPTTDLSGGARVWRSVKFSANDKTLFDMHPPPSSPLEEQLTGMRICAKIRVHYIDDSLGESIPVGLTLPAAFARMEIFEVTLAGVGRRLFSGEANADGCAPRLEEVHDGGGYLLKVESRLRSTSRNIDVNVLEPSANSLLDLTPTMAATMFSIDVGWPSSSITMTFSHDRRFNAAAAIGQILSRPAITVPSGVYPVHLDQCNGAKIPTEAEQQAGKKVPYTACYSPWTGVLWLGRNADVRRSHNVDWKFVVAHEFGHAILFKQKASPRLPDTQQEPYGATSAHAACRCDHVIEDEDKTHCMQSKEYLGDVETEGLAHMIAANTWNVLDENACNFVYYKNVKAGFLLLAPVSVSCHAKFKWMDTACPEGDRGVEWDWMNWMHSLNVNPLASRLTTADVGTLFAQACGGDCVGKEPTPEQLIRKARDLYGIGHPKAVAVEFAIVAYGAKY